MADFVLKNNYFEFNRQIKQEISGTTIGIKFAPSYAYFSRIKIKLIFLKPKNYSLWRGFDILTIFPLSGHMVSKSFFLRSLNEFHTDIKFTYESSKESIAFLELKVSVKNSKIITDLYVKSTDRHQYLHYMSAHPNHTKQSVVFNWTLCISKLCSYDKNLIKHKANMKSWFLKREYPKKLISAAINKVS